MEAHLAAILVRAPSIDRCAVGSSQSQTFVDMLRKILLVSAENFDMLRNEDDLEAADKEIHNERRLILIFLKKTENDSHTYDSWVNLQQLQDSQLTRVLKRRNLIKIILRRNKPEDVTVRSVGPPKRFEMEIHMYEIYRATEVYYDDDGDNKAISSTIRWLPEMRRWRNFGKPYAG